MKKQIDEHEADLAEAKEILFHRTSEELDGYHHAREKWGEELARIQHERFIGLYGAIEECG